ncbi:MAG: redoxin domain-containing protein [Candidatus Altiarchaeota archaeon]|nr:redoxin domain-containing protein [Candidatus Altiarchaeota archaeon]
MGSDPSGLVCKTFGTYIEDEGVSLRGTFIVDPDGILKSMSIHDNSIGRSAKEILRKLRAAKHVRDNPGQVCPASWEPGEAILKPSIDLIGKI